MRVLCEEHGEQFGIEISPDLLDAFAKKRLPPETPRLVRFTFDDNSGHWEILVSSNFMKEKGISNVEAPAPDDDFPTWCNEVRPVCVACARERFGLRNL